MSEYFEYLGNMIGKFFGHLGTFFYKAIVSPWVDVGGNFKEYNSILNECLGKCSSPFLFWLMFGIFALLMLAVLFGVGFVLFLLIKKYVKFAKTEIDKDELKNQIDRLNYELWQTIQEKDRILGLQMKQLGPKNPDDMKDGEEEADEMLIDELASRFPKLTHVDNTYKDKDMTIPDVPGLTLPGLCEAFRNFACSQMGLYYKLNTVRQMFAGMGSGKLIILEGISGTGKTSFPYSLGKFFCHDAEICAVQPNWKDRSELLGYYNEFTKKFNESEFLRALYTVRYRQDPNLIVLDEMNLARVEYYFAEMLSVLEMPNPDEWDIEVIGSHDARDPKLIEGGKIKIPINTVFFGTANNDDSTFTISDKVYDRAICLFFDDKGYPFECPQQGPMQIPWSQMQALFDECGPKYPVSQTTLDKFGELDAFVIKKFRLAFGNRIMKQLKKFVPIYVGCGGTELDGIDFIFTNKILKKFESLNIGFLKNELKELLQMLDKLFGADQFPMAHNFINNMLRMN